MLANAYMNVHFSKVLAAPATLSIVVFYFGHYLVLQALPASSDRGERMHSRWHRARVPLVDRGVHFILLR